MCRYILKTVLFILILSQLFNLEAFGDSKTELAGQLYLRGLLAFENKDFSLALDLFDEAIRYDRKHADALHMAAKVLMEMNTVHSRFMATIRLEKALNLDWNNPEYRFTYAMLHLKKDMSGVAFKEFEKVIKYDPFNYLAYFEMAKILEKQAIRYRDMIDPDPGGIIYFRNFAENDKERIIYYYTKTIALKPDFTSAYYRLALIYYEFGSLNEMKTLLETSVKVNPADKNSHLFLGFAYNLQRLYAQAEVEFNAALELMDADEKQLFRSIEPILSPDQLDEFGELADPEKQNYINTYWMKRDPLFATKFNERQLEHFSRIAYVNLRFSDFEKGIEGWRTDQGKVYIRYGKPSNLFRTRPEFGGIGASEFGALSTSKEVWSYKDFNFVFDDRFLSNRYEFAWGDMPENDYRSVYDQLIREVPEVHEIVEERDRLQLAAAHSAFYKNEEGVDIYFNAAFPSDSIYFVSSNGSWKANLKHGLYLFDPDWKKIYEFTDGFNLDENSRVVLGDHRYLIDQLIAEVTYDSMVLVYELYDLESDRMGSHRSPISVPNYSAKRLGLSDIMVLFRIDPVRPDLHSLNKADLIMVPNPLKRYQSGDPMYIYFEIYGLMKNMDGLTSFSIEYTIMTDKKRSNRIKRLLTSLGIFEATGDVTTSFQYQGDSAIEYQYQQITFSRKLQGDLILNVRINDLISGNLVEKQLYLVIE